MRCRKNCRDLTATERDRFVQALYHVKSTGVVDQFASLHETFFHQGIHGTSHFLPWHRELLRLFEDALRTYHPDISIPYWDSTVDTSPSDPLWDHNFLGQFDAAWGLGRVLGSDTLPTPDQVQTALGLATYNAFWPNLESVIHNPPHRWVEGKMRSLDSPADPVFYLHHCWIDLLWAQWQLLHPGEAFVSSGSGFGLNDPLASWTTTPADVLDHRAINLYHYPPAFQQDLPIVTLDTPVINFIDVPEGETRLGAAVFNLIACEPVHFTVVSGPTVTSGPPATEFNLFISPIPPADPKVDKKGRVWLTYQGTGDGDTATGTVTIRCEETGEEFSIDITANTIGRPSAAIVMVLDTSNSMNFESGIAPGVTRADVLKFSAPPAIVVSDDEHAMAVCTFDHDAHPGIGMTPVAGGGKLLINGAISSYAPNPNGWTSIGEGVAFAHDILGPVTGYDVKAMVVLTDGQENHGPHTRRYISDVADMISGLNGHVFAIGLGRPEVLNPAALEALCNGNKGYMEVTGDLTPDASFRLAKYYQQILAGVTNNEVVLDPEGWILPGQEHRIEFWLNETDITAKAILLTPAPFAIPFVLETPDGDIIDPGVAGANPMASFEIGDQVSLYRTGLPIPLGANEAQAGRWYAILKVNEKYYRRYLSLLDNNPKLLSVAGTHGIRYSFNVHAYSNLRMKVSLAQTSYEPGATIMVRAVLTEYGLPVASRANCRAELTRPDNTTTTLQMPEVEPGVFEATTPASIPGVYRFRILADGHTLRGRPFTREQTRTGAVWRGGDNPPPSSKDDPNRRDDRFCRLINCLLQQKDIQKALKKAGISSDELRRCLEEYGRKPSPGQPPGVVQPKLADRLKLLIRDDRVLQVVLREFEFEFERKRK
jgi:hypothetical protein